MMMMVSCLYRPPNPSISSSLSRHPSAEEAGVGVSCSIAAPSRTWGPGSGSSNCTRQGPETRPLDTGRGAARSNTLEAHRSSSDRKSPARAFCWDNTDRFGRQSCTLARGLSTSDCKRRGRGSCRACTCRACLRCRSTAARASRSRSSWCRCRGRVSGRARTACLSRPSNIAGSRSGCGRCRLPAPGCGHPGTGFSGPTSSTRAARDA